MEQDGVNIKFFDSPSDAPNYNLPEYRNLLFDSAVIVSNGTVDGNPTVDLVFKDESGQKHVALIKGSFLEAIGAAITGKRLQSMD